MTLQLINPQDADLNALTDKTIAVIGYGNQGHAHALNLRDSGPNVIVAQRPDSTNHDRALRDRFTPVSAAEAARRADLLILALPDESAADVYQSDIAPNLRPNQTLGFVHGFNIRYNFITPPPHVSCVLVAPKGPGSLLRSLYLDGRGLPALIAVHHDATGQARQTALAWASGIGSARAAIAQTTFAEETESDLFGEQVVLCGGVSALTKAAFETLVEAGIEPEIAYLECIHELKQVVDLIYEQGLSGMRRRVSNTAEYGDLTRGPTLITPEVRAQMRRILTQIRDGSFADEWIAEARAAMPNLKRLYQQDADSHLERAGRNVRKMMPWLPNDQERPN